MPLLRLPPHRIETKRLVLRCWEPRDAEPLVQAIAANLEHLRPWMPWAEHEPQPVEMKARRIEAWKRKFEAGNQFWYGLFTSSEHEVLGGIGLHRDIGSGAASIGYWIRRDHANQGLVTEAAGALMEVGFGLLQLARMEIHCDPSNQPSAAVARKLGFTLAVTIRNCVRTPTASPRDTAIYVKRADSSATSPLS